MRALLLLFVASGLIGLAYQVLWSRWLLLLVGASAPTHAVVLAAFMGGLAIGARWLGPVADRVRSPLRLYAMLELGLAAWALAWPALARGAEALIGPGLSWGGPAALLARAALAGLLLLPPTIAMGGTWPTVVRQAVRTPELIGRRGAGLYAANAAGAVVGALLMAYVLLPGLGLSGSLSLLALGSALLAGVAWGLARPRRSAAPPAAPAAAPRRAAGDLALPGGAIVCALAGAGALTFSHEIAWTRLFSIALGSSTYSFAVMLASFVAGIALGSAVLARCDDRVGSPLRALAWTQLAGGAFVLLVLPAGPLLPWAFGRLASLVTGSWRAFALHELAKLLACSAVLLPLAVLTGLSLPLALKAAARRSESVGRDTGRLYAANTWGNVVGALAAGLVLLPALGVERLLAATAAGGIALGLVLLLTGRARRDRLPAVGVAVASIAWALAWPGWNAAWFTLTPARQAPPPFARARAFVQEWDVLFTRDDPASHVLVTQARGVEPPHRVLFVNGKPDASSGDDMATQLLLAHLPLVLHPHAQDVLVIGLASGVTAGAALRHPIEHLEIVDLAGATAEVTAFFSPWNHDPLADPRTQFVVDDGRSRIRSGTGRHDLIVSEPSNPWVAGVGSLYTREFFAAAADRLHADGCYVQWVQSYELSDGTLAAVVRTFRQTFPHVRVFQVGSWDLLMLGRLAPFEPDWPAARGRLQRPGVAEDLAPLGISSLDDLLAREVLSEASVDWLASLVEAEITDDNQLLEHRAPRDLFLGATPSIVRRLDERGTAAPSLLRRRIGPPARPEEPAPRPGAVAVLAHGDRVRTVAWLRENGARLLAGAAADPVLALEWEAALARRVRTQDEATAHWALLRVDLLAAAGWRDEARAALESLIASEAPPSVETAVLRACRIGPADACRAVVESELARRPSPVLERLAALHAAGGASDPGEPVAP